MQAIQTKYIGPRNVKGSRVKASAQAGSITLEWDDSLNSELNHLTAALALARRYKWDGKWTCGWLPDGTCVWVCDCNNRNEQFTISRDQENAA